MGLEFLFLLLLICLPFWLGLCIAWPYLGWLSIPVVFAVWTAVTVVGALIVLWVHDRPSRRPPTP